MPLVAVLAWICVAKTVSAQETSGFVAGTAPSQRPPGAPVLGAYDKSEAWFTAARTGITKPYPASLSFLDDQGAWFNPFIRPGMTGPYDIRGWHRDGAKGAPGD
jgi:hypothetical protein